MQTGSSVEKIVIFRLGREEYAVSIGAVREVGSWTQPTPVPEAPPVVEGVIDLRGEILPVIDLGKLFRTGRERANPDSRVMVMEVQGQQAGFVVDDVTEVLSVPPESVSKASPVLHSQMAGGAGASVVSGIVKLGSSRLVVLVDPVKILSQVSY